MTRWWPVASVLFLSQDYLDNQPTPGFGVANSGTDCWITTNKTLHIRRIVVYSFDLVVVLLPPEFRTKPKTRNNSAHTFYCLDKYTKLSQRRYNYSASSTTLVSVVVETKTLHKKRIMTSTKWRAIASRALATKSHRPPRILMTLLQ